MIQGYLSEIYVDFYLGIHYINVGIACNTTKLVYKLNMHPK